MRIARAILCPLLIMVLPTFGQAQVSKPDLIGMIVPLTGFVAEYGIAVRNGVQMYVEDHAESCSNVTFEWEDGQYSGPKTITAFRKFAAQGVQLQYVWGSAPAEVVVPIAERESIPLFVLAESDTVAGRSFAFNLTSPSWDFSRYVLEELRKRGRKKIAIVKAEYVYFNRLVDGLKKFLLPDEKLEIVASFQPDELNFRPAITKIRNGQFDAVGVLLDPAQGSNFFRQTAEQKLQIQSFGSTNFGSTKVIADAQGNMEGALFSDTAVDPEFRERYIRKFGDGSYVSTAAQSYDMTQFICSLRRGARGKGVIEQILTMSAARGVSGKITLAGTLEGGRYFRFPIAVSEIQKGGPKVISIDGQPVMPDNPA